MKQSEIARRLSERPLLLGRYHQCIGRAETMLSPEIERDGALEDEPKDQFSCMRREVERLPLAMDRSHLRDSASRFSNRRFPRFSGEERRQWRPARAVVQESLPGEIAISINTCVGQGHAVIGESRMKRRTSDLDDFEAR